MLHNCLAHDHPVKRISMKKRKPCQIQSRLFIQWKGIDVVLLSLYWDKFCRRLGKRQLAERILNGDLPSRNRTQIDLIVGIFEQLPRLVGELGSTSNGPQECDGV